MKVSSAIPSRPGHNSMCNCGILSEDDTLLGTLAGSYGTRSREREKYDIACRNDFLQGWPCAKCILAFN